VEEVLGSPLPEWQTSAEEDERPKSHVNKYLSCMKKSKILLFCQNLWRPVSVILWIIVIVEFVVMDYIDWILICANLVSAIVSFYEANKAVKVVEATSNPLPPTTIAKQDGVWDHRFDATKLVTSDLIEPLAAAAAPADSIANYREIEMEEGPILGESLPATPREGRMAQMGATIEPDDTQATGVSPGNNTFSGKTDAVVAVDKGLSSMKTLLLLILIMLVLLSILLCLICLFYQLIVGPVGTNDLSKGVTLQLLVLFFVALFSFKPIGWLAADPSIIPGTFEWQGYFLLPVFTLTVIIVRNENTLGRIGRPNAKASPWPEHLNMPMLLLLSIIIGGLACASSMILLWSHLPACRAPLDWDRYLDWNAPSLYSNKCQIPGFQYGQIINIFYRILLIDNVSGPVYVVKHVYYVDAGTRTQDPLFPWASDPGFVLWIGATIALLCSTPLALLWPEGTVATSPDPVDQYKAIFVFFVFVFRDFISVGSFSAFYWYNYRNMKALFEDLLRTECKEERADGGCEGR